MARSNLTAPTQDLQKDGGAILFSFVQGEQQEYPVVIDFVEDVSSYILEAVVLEGANILGEDEIPQTVADTPAIDTLDIRVPQYMGEWILMAFITEMK